MPALGSCAETGNIPDQYIDFCLLSLVYMMNAMSIIRRLLRHCADRACLRAAPRAGRRIEISSAMMPITTSNSTSVNPPRILVFDSSMIVLGSCDIAGWLTADHWAGCHSPAHFQP